jgi:hypothetical protein
MEWDELKKGFVMCIAGIIGIAAIFFLMFLLMVLGIAAMNEISCALEVYHGLQCGPG